MRVRRGFNGFSRRFFVGFLAVVVALAGLSIARGQSVPIIEGNSRAYDGDGVYVHNIKIRLWGIDAPELDTEYGEAAYAALSNYVDGEQLRCKPPPGQKSFPSSWDRKVALCTLKGNDVARFLVENGYAVDFPFFSNGYYD